VVLSFAFASCFLPHGSLRSTEILTDHSYLSLFTPSGLLSLLFYSPGLRLCQAALLLDRFTPTKSRSPLTAASRHLHSISPFSSFIYYSPAVEQH
jgi:hypothetical protein